MNKLFIFFALNTFVSSFAFAMEQKITTSVGWGNPNGIIFYYTLPGDTTIHTLKQRISTSLLNNKKLKTHYLYVELMVGYDNVVIQDNETIANLFKRYQSREYELFTFFDNKRQTPDPIDEPFVEVEDIEPTMKKRRR